MKNVAQMENDMERWLTDREKISKQLETVRKRKLMLESGGSSTQVSSTLNTALLTKIVLFICNNYAESNFVTISVHTSKCLMFVLIGRKPVQGASKSIGRVRSTHGIHPREHQ